MAWRWLICILAVLLDACLKPPPSLDDGPLTEVTLRDAQSRDLIRRRVRWGGSIVTTTPGKEETCFEIVSRPLDREARPRRTDESDGRFLACAPGFFDPAVFAAGREVTVVGTVQAATTGRIGDYEYRYQRVAVERVFLWPQREPVQAYYYDDPWPGPFWYPLWRPWPYW